MIIGINVSVSGHRRGETPVLISNTEAKPSHGVACTALRAGKRAAADT